MNLWFPVSRFRSALTFISVLVSATGAWAAAAAINVTCDRPAGVYESGQTAVFTVIRNDTAETAPVATVKILRNNRELVHTETVTGTEAEHAVSFTPKDDGWYFCSVTLPGEEKKPAATTGVVFNPDAYTPSMPAPADFDAFWATQKARLAADKAVPVLTPLTPEQLSLETANPDPLKKITALESQGYTCVNLEIPCLDVRPVEGYFAKPKSPVKGGHPAILLFHAAGVAGGWCRASLVNTLGHAEKYNALVVDMNAHGMLNGQPQSYYDALEKGELAGYQNRGKESREQFYFLGMFLRLQRAIDFLAEQPEWDGKHLICIGISQGGAQVLAAAGLDSRVSAAVATVPGMCDFTGPVAGKPAGWPGIGNGSPADPQTKVYLNTVSYFDAVNFCARSKAETLVTVGFVDTTCSAPGVFTAYNQLKAAKRIITVPDKGHHALSSPTPELNAEYTAFVAAHTKN
ncbi:MAG: acetylxylan esterase [Opitutaceae bacterium]|jgi:cephalosporin-C deacetylase-like acetyl esterase